MHVYYFCTVKTFDETARHHWDSMEKEWESEKQKILNALVDSAGETVDFIQDSDVCTYWPFTFMFFMHTVI